MCYLILTARHKATRTGRAAAVNNHNRPQAGRYNMKKRLFRVLEIGKGIHQEYTMIKTDGEMSAYLKAMNENYGYIPGLGGDKNYSIVAWYERG